MIEQVSAGTTTKRRRSRLVSKQNGTQPTPSKRPTNDDKEAWKAYWKEKGQWWRMEPEIDGERQKYLADRRTITPDIQQGIYPFKDIEPRLSRADVEWLLATHENGRGPIDWSDEHQRNRKGLDLRGAILSTIDLSYLPLARTCGGLTAREWDAQETNQRELARIHLEGAHLFRAHLEGADFSGANMEGADLSYIFMERFYLVEVHLEGARLHKAHLEHAYLREAHLEGSHLTQAYLHEADLSLAHLEGKEVMSRDLERVRMWDKSFPAILPPAELNGSFFDSGTKLENISFGDKKHGFVSLADLHWGDANLLTVNWAVVPMLGDEGKTREQKNRNGEKKDRQMQLQEHLAAVRANRQVAVGLQNQGLNEEAAYFAYRAQKLQRTVLRLQRRFGQYLFSLLLDLLAGYGYKPERSVFWYLVMIFGFAITYYGLGHLPLFPDAFVFSLTSFHGRGFFPGLGNETSLHNPLVVLAAIEGVFGLLIEISFIATFTQRFFGK